MKNVKFILNLSIRGRPKGSHIDLKCDNNGQPIDPFWRRRLQDAKIDGCMKLYVEPKPEAAKEDGEADTSETEVAPEPKPKAKKGGKGQRGKTEAV